MIFLCHNVTRFFIAKKGKHMSKTRQLQDMTDIETVIRFLNIKATRKGTSFFILCPNPNHPDTKPANCYFKKGWGNVYCMACGKATRAIQLLMDAGGYDSKEATNILWKINGSPTWFRDYDSGKSVFTPDASDLAFVGLHHLRGRLTYPKKEVAIKEAGKEYAYENLLSDLDNYMEVGVEYINWQDVFKVHELKNLIRQKAFEKRDRVHKLIKTGELDSAAGQEYLKRCQEIAKKYSPGKYYQGKKMA